MTSKNGTAIAYDYDNRPTSIGASTFVYDYAGQRVKKNGTVYIGNIYECTGSVCTKYIFAGGTRIAMKSGSTVNYYHTDHLGSSSIVTNASGTKVEELYYYPYGATRVNTGSVNVKHKYTGQEEDAETGLYYYGARYYDPTIGRFISADTIVQAPGYPQTLNRYSYAGNNPIIYTDPSGHFIEGFIVGAIIGGFIAGVQSDWNFQAVLTGAIIGGISGGVFAEASAFTQGALGGVVQSGTSGGMISGMVGGGAAGATAGGLNAAYYGGNIGDAMLRGAGLGAAGGAAFGAIGVPNSFGKAGAYALAGGGLSELGGGDFWQGVALSGGAALAMMGWEYMRDWTDASSLKGSARVHKYNEYGELLTTGKRQCVGCTPDNTNSFTGSGGYEGSDGLVYNNRAINVISKTHDFGMGWSYQGTGNFVAGGQFYNSAVQAYSYAAMPIAAAYTGFAFSADPFAQTLIYGLSVK
ncbi:MAG: RHS repeat-associated core domain-containing protein, partial [Syntrophales bacterium]